MTMDRYHQVDQLFTALAMYWDSSKETNDERLSKGD